MVNVLFIRDVTGLAYLMFRLQDVGDLRPEAEARIGSSSLASVNNGKSVFVDARVKPGNALGLALNHRT